MSAPETIVGARVGVIGLARSGTAAARLLAERGAMVYASDVAETEEVAENAALLEAAGVAVEVGGHDPDRLVGCDWVVTSPGVPPDALALRALEASGVPVYSELEVASWFAEAPIAAVTGTNGKTTTTALAAHLLRSGGLDAEAAGNIGRPLSQIALAERQPEWVAVELSSFQLADLEQFTPESGLMLNLSPDHLDRYRDVASYYADKARLFANAGPRSQWVLNADDTAVLDVARNAEGERWHFSVERPVERGAWVGEGALWARLGVDTPVRWAEVQELRLLGRHNVANALAAGVAAGLAGCGGEAIGRGLRSFEALPHRLQPIGQRGGVLWVNDSKATNVAACAVALRAFDRPLVLLLGGRHKGEPYTTLLPELRRKARAVVAYGEAAPQIVADVGSEAPRLLVESTLESAVQAAARLARPGDVVLLSPACSSYDLFPDYEARGRAFEEAFRHLNGTEPGPGGKSA